MGDSSMPGASPRACAVIVQVRTWRSDRILLGKEQEMERVGFARRKGRAGRREARANVKQVSEDATAAMHIIQYTRTYRTVKRKIYILLLNRHLSPIPYKQNELMLRRQGEKRRLIQFYVMNPLLLARLGRQCLSRGCERTDFASLLSSSPLSANAKGRESSFQPRGRGNIAVGWKGEVKKVPLKKQQHIREVTFDTCLKKRQAEGHVPCPLPMGTRPKVEKWTLSGDTDLDEAKGWIPLRKGGFPL